MQRLPRACAILIGFTLAAVVDIGDAHAVDCMNAKGPGHPWAWRQIDGKRCWYKGKAGMDKKRLRWSATVGARPAKRLMTAPTNNDELLHTVWPPRDTFIDRFKGDRK